MSAWLYPKKEQHLVSPNTRRTPQIGEVYLMNFGGNGSEQVGMRPGIVFQNNKGNAHSPNIIALPVSSSLKKLDLPTHVLLKASDTGLHMDSVVLCENPAVMSKSRIGKYIGKLSEDYMKKVSEANLLATSAIAFLDIESLIEIRRKAVALNA